MKVKLLLVDDHPIILDGYRNILNSFNQDELDLIIETASDCDEAYLKITKSKATLPYNIIFLDISLPPSEHYPIYSGEDLGLKVREFLPNCKLVILTMYTDNLRLFNIMKNLKPEGLLIKSDVTPKNSLQLLKKYLLAIFIIVKPLTNLVESISPRISILMLWIAKFYTIFLKESKQKTLSILLIYHYLL